MRANEWSAFDKRPSWSASEDVIAGIAGGLSKTRVNGAAYTRQHHNSLLRWPVFFTAEFWACKRRLESISMKRLRQSLLLNIAVWFASVGAITVTVAGHAFADFVPIEEGSWTLAVLPDTQFYVRDHPEHFLAQTRWIAEHAKSHNIKFVLHEGDITMNGNVYPVQWERSVEAIDLLNGVVPYALVTGNHDCGERGNARQRTSKFNEDAYFGPRSYYAKQPTVGGFFEAGRTDDSYHTFTANGCKWLVLALGYSPPDAVVAWANRVVEEHPDHLVMLVTHCYMYSDDTRYDRTSKRGQKNSPARYGNDGQLLWDKLVRQHEGFRFVFSGHVLDDGTGLLSSRGDHNNVVHQMLANYQFKTEGGQGDMRLLEFRADGETIAVRTYSPVLDRCDEAPDQTFDLNMNRLATPNAVPAASVAQ